MPRAAFVVEEMLDARGTLATRNAVMAAMRPTPRQRVCVICLDGAMTHLVIERKREFS